MPIWIVAVNESRPNYVSYHFIFFLKIWLGGWNIRFHKHSKVSILFCYFLVILLTGSNDRFSEKIHKLEIYPHHFTWLLYLVICHFGKNCRTRLKISEMTIYIYQPIEVVSDQHCHGYFLQFSILYFNLYQNDKWLNKADMWNGVNTSLIHGFSH